jgi:hypothetical protein
MSLLMLTIRTMLLYIVFREHLQDFTEYLQKMKILMMNTRKNLKMIMKGE